MIPLNCQSTSNSAISSSMSNGGSMQSLQNIESDNTNLGISSLSSIGVSSVSTNPCSPISMSPMRSHYGYATSVTPSPVHTTHPHNGGLSSINDAFCYGRSVYDPGKYQAQLTVFSFLDCLRILLNSLESFFPNVLISLTRDDL